MVDRHNGPAQDRPLLILRKQDWRNFLLRHQLVERRQLLPQNTFQIGAQQSVFLLQVFKAHPGAIGGACAGRSPLAQNIRDLVVRMGGEVEGILGAFVPGLHELPLDLGQFLAQLAGKLFCLVPIAGFRHPLRGLVQPWRDVARSEPGFPNNGYRECP